MSLDELDEMSKVDMNNIDKSKLVDIQTIKIDPTQSAVERMESYLKDVKNPYLFLCGETAVHVRFEPNGQDLSQKLKTHFISTKKS